MVLIYPSFCLLQNILIKEIIGHGGLYYMEDFSVGKAHYMYHPSNIKREQILLWHRRLGHPSFEYLKHVFPSLFSDTSLLNLKCETCILAKSHRTHFPLSMNKSDVPFALIHSDVWGPSPKSSSLGFRWFVMFVDDCTRMTWVFVLTQKNEVFQTFQVFHQMI
uniref:Retrovirus-related Pol polyprotein from transposon TNT 1-94 n=1 Tax=Cajanus cajan TaxID=3821 RepID=A0A151QX92_CAJCA|nr:Retrovirus-related Pol polyprotein from transposon TNT 1-94 [Cajanus cajan]